MFQVAGQLQRELTLHTTTELIDHLECRLIDLRFLLTCKKTSNISLISALFQGSEFEDVKDMKKT